MAGSIFNRDQWLALIDFMTDAMVKMEKAFREPLGEINRKLGSRERGSLGPALDTAHVEAI
jgi:hypothetical protein